MRVLNVLTGANYWFGFEIFASADSSTLIGEKDVPNLKVKNSTEHGWPWQTAHSDSCDLCGVNPAALKSTLRSLLLFSKDVQESSFHLALSKMTSHYSVDFIRF
jgi:hypothetical protein